MKYLIMDSNIHHNTITEPQQAHLLYVSFEQDGIANLGECNYKSNS